MLDSKQLVTDAAVRTTKLTPAEAAAKHGQPDVLFVDVREKSELDKTGTVKGAIHVPRGFIEFKADPNSPNHEKALDPDKQLVLFCASGMRATLAARTLADMGYKNVAHVGGGGFDALKQAGVPTAH